MVSTNTDTALELFKVMLAAKPDYIGGLSKSALGEWCENVVAAGYRLAAASPPPLDVERLADDVRYADGGGTSDYWRGYNDGIDKLAAAIARAYAAEDK